MNFRKVLSFLKRAEIMMMILVFLMGSFGGWAIIFSHNLDGTSLNENQLFSTIVMLILFRTYKYQRKDAISFCLGGAVTCFMCFFAGYQIGFLVTEIIQFLVIIVLLQLIYFKIVPKLREKLKKE